ncbi:RagB/SusD family nutrient uptake outer membrane protein, partial [Bacteroides cellulosilyticus]
YDLRRWGKLSEVLGKRGFSEGKHNFFPIPLWEVNANSALNNTTEGTEE